MCAYIIRSAISSVVTFITITMTFTNLLNLLSSKNNTNSLNSIVGNRMSSMIKSLKQGISWPLSFIKLNRDTRNMRDKITTAGKDHEVYQVETEDGYLLNLDRIPNKESFNVVYF